MMSQRVNEINQTALMGRGYIAATRYHTAVHGAKLVSCVVSSSYPVPVLRDCGHDLAEFLAHVHLVGVKNDEN